jgi:hypothetical protein
MVKAARVADVIVRVMAVILIVLGVLIWTGNFDGLIPVHITAGVILVLTLWTLAVLAAVAGINRGLIVLAIVWGLIVPVLGLTQTQLVYGSAHWVIQVIHLLVGIGAIAQASRLAALIRVRAASPKVSVPEA